MDAGTRGGWVPPKGWQILSPQKGKKEYGSIQSHAQNLATMQ